MFISWIQELLHSNVNNDPLLLAYGALASKSAPKVQQQAVKFLIEKLDHVQESGGSLVPLIHSLGNLGTNLTVDVLLEFVSDKNLEVQLAAMYALRKNIKNPLVQEAFITVLKGLDLHVQGEQIAVMAQTLSAGLEHCSLFGMKLSISPVLNKELASAAMSVKNAEIRSLVAQYFLDLNTPDSTKYALVLTTNTRANSTHTRSRRSTNNWDSSSSLYDLVSSHSNRINDENNYPNHRAYLWGKKFGVDELNVQFAAGVFAGVNNVGFDDLRESGVGAINYKLFGRAVAKGHAFGRTKTAFDAQLLNVKNDNTRRLKMYANIVGHVLVDYDSNSETRRKRQSSDPCISRQWPLYSSRYTLLSFSHSIFIYVGILTIGIDVTAELCGDARAELCANRDISIDASATLIPEATVRIDGSASASLLVSLTCYILS